MKNILNIILAGMLVSLASCSDGYIDDITPVAQGTDSSAPIVDIISPTATKELLPLNPLSIKTKDFVFQYSVKDDIEIESVDVYLDGNKLNSYVKFLDYRNFSNTFTYKSLGVGNHIFKVDAKDKSGKSTSKTFAFSLDKYAKINSNEVVYLPFTAGNDFMDFINSINFSKIGNPNNISGGRSGLAYQGAADSYISLPLTGLYSSDGISFTFWYKVDATPVKSGIIIINDDNDDTNENRTGGLRLFREGNASSQTIKLNVGTGSGESWNDGGNIAVDGKWVHIAVTVSPTESKIYFDGVLQRTSTYTTPFDFSKSSTVVIGSGAPSFTYWDHKSDLSLIDDVRIYDRALSKTEVENTMK